MQYGLFGAFLHKSEGLITHPSPSCKAGTNQRKGNLEARKPEIFHKDPGSEQKPKFALSSSGGNFLYKLISLASSTWI